MQLLSNCAWYLNHSLIQRPKADKHHDKCSPDPRTCCDILHVVFATDPVNLYQINLYRYNGTTKIYVWKMNGLEKIKCT